MPFNPGNVRKVNALGGKRPQATGIVLIPKNNGNVLKTSNGSTANYGGNTKFGLYPNVGMSYLFQNKIGVGSLFYNTTTPSQATPPVPVSGNGEVPSGSTVTFEFYQTDTYGIAAQLQADPTQSDVAENGVGTTALNQWTDGDTTNREWRKNDDGQAIKWISTANNPLVESVIPLYLLFQNGNPDAEPKIFVALLDGDATANYTLTWSQTAQGVTYSNTVPFIFTSRSQYDATAQNILYAPPIGSNGVWDVTVPMTDIAYAEGSGGYNAAGDQEQLPVNFYDVNGTYPLVITITKN